MPQFSNAVKRPQLADTTSGREGALLVGTDTKLNLDNATTVEAALTSLDTFVSETDAALLTAPDLFGWNDWRNPPGDPFEIRTNYGLTVTRNGDIYYVDWLLASNITLTAGDGITITPVGGDFTIESIVTISGGQGITIVQSGQDFTVHQRESRTVLTDGATVTLDCANDNNFRLNMGASPTGRTLALSNVSVGQKFSILLKQAGSNTVTWWSGILWPGGVAPTLTSTASKGDMYAFECIASGVYLGFIVNQDFDLTGV
jgi:hypothetical protein